MMPTRRIKKINGIEYWYEDIPYYDREKKQIRHKSKYLGRNVNGEPVRVRDALNSNEDISPCSKSLKAYNYGELLPLQWITDELKLGEYLGDLFNEKEMNMILSMVFNRITRPTAMYNLKKSRYKTKNLMRFRLSLFDSGKQKVRYSDTPEFMSWLEVRFTSFQHFKPLF